MDEIQKLINRHCAEEIVFFLIYKAVDNKRGFIGKRSREPQSDYIQIESKVTYMGIRLLCHYSHYRQWCLDIKRIIIIRKGSPTRTMEDKIVLTQRETDAIKIIHSVSPKLCVKCKWSHKKQFAMTLVIWWERNNQIIRLKKFHITDPLRCVNKERKEQKRRIK